MYGDFWVHVSYTAPKPSQAGKHMFFCLERVLSIIARSFFFRVGYNNAIYALGYAFFFT
jgi:hypothetical protein